MVLKSSVNRKYLVLACGGMPDYLVLLLEMIQLLRSIFRQHQLDRAIR